MGFETVAEVIRTLKGKGRVFFWLVLTKEAKEGPWMLYALLVEAFPAPSNGRSAREVRCEYGSVVAISGRLAGNVLAAWIEQGIGEVRSGKTTNYAFGMPAFQSPDTPSVSTFTMASHHTSGATTADWPYTQYSVPLENLPTFTGEAPFIGSRGCPSFPTFAALVAELVFGATASPALVHQLGNRAIIIRVAQTSAWFEHLHLSPGRLTISVKGHHLHGARVEAKGSPALWIDQTLKKGEVEQIDGDMQIARVVFPMPKDVPHDLWIVLSRRGTLLDESYPTAAPLPFAPKANNVTSEVPTTAKMTTVYSPFALTPREGGKHLAEIDARASQVDLSEDQFKTFVDTFFTTYRQTLETYFPSLASYTLLYARHPFHSFVLPLGNRGAVIGHKPAAQAGTTVMHAEDFDPPLETINVFDIAQRWEAAVVSFDLQARPYDAVRAKDEGIRRAKQDALEIFWRVITPSAFHAICLELLNSEGVELDERLDRWEDAGFDAIGRVALHEPAYFRRQETWAFQFTHATNNRISVSAIREAEKFLDSAPMSPDIICLVTSGDVTSIGQNVALNDMRIRVWDRPVLNLLLDKHLDAIAPYFPTYAEASERLAHPEEPLHPEGLVQSQLTSFEERLRSCPSGKEHFAQYEAIGTEIWSYLFSSALTSSKPQIRTQDKAQRRDVLFKNRKATPFWTRVGQRFAADFIIVDFKNYKDPVDADIVNDVAKYANEALGRLVVIVSRHGGDQGVLNAQIRMFRDNKKFVLVVSDAQMLEMVKRKEHGANPEDVLEDLLDSVLTQY